MEAYNNLEQLGRMNNMKKQKILKQEKQPDLSIDSKILLPIFI